MAAAKTTAPTVTLKHLAAALATEHEMSKKASEAIMNDLIAMMVKHLKKGERIRIGEPIKIKASKKVAFRAAKELKEAV